MVAQFGADAGDGFGAEGEAQGWPGRVDYGEDGRGGLVGVVGLVSVLLREAGSQVAAGGSVVVSTRIKRLTETDLIENDGAAADARSRPIRATPAGHELWANATAERTHREAALVRAALPGDALDDVNDRLAGLLATVERDLGTGPRHDVPRRDTVLRDVPGQTSSGA
ncbi:hypothetical protein [Nocardia vermiculata]|uniref:Uncharacterized protein n=1 Tax=Nocardia vermiculata TaxID=257274 RepID=A0A846XRZ9_9NOCA|nr:hypothetical protein [Nocardia vermiculata]NKY48872.1 hypothetical protein [Nocardia vermiculata]